MMNPDPTDSWNEGDPTEAAAMDWLIERDEGFAPGRAEAFAQWCHSNPRHVEAVARLEATWGMLNRLPALAAVDTPAKSEPRRRWLRRLALWSPIAAAAAITLLLLPLRESAPSPSEFFSAEDGAIRRVELPDGSRLTLKGGSEVSVHYGESERRVRLRTGEAHFVVAPDSKRPFLVAAGGFTARAVGTAFNVRLAGSTVEVLVSSGRVQLAPDDVIANAAPSASGCTPVLERGDQAVAGSRQSSQAPTVTHLDPAQLQAALAWREELLVFKETPLREVIARFNRYNHVQLRLGDEALGQRPIGGRFAADNVEVFVQLLERGGDLVLERRGDREIILRQGP